MQPLPQLAHRGSRSSARPAASTRSNAASPGRPGRARSAGAPDRRGAEAPRVGSHGVSSPIHAGSRSTRPSTTRGLLDIPH